MANLSTAGWELLERARREGILHDILEEKLDFERGVISVPCSDGDQSHDWRTHLGGLVARKRGGEVRDHVIALNGGGALLLSPKSPLRTLRLLLPEVLLHDSKLPSLLRATCAFFLGLVGYLWRQDWVVMVNLWFAMKMKEIRTIVLPTHFPCGAAGLCHMIVEEQFLHLILGKRRLKRWFSGVYVPCFVHVDWTKCAGCEHRKKCTYFVKTHELEAWLKSLANPT